MNVSKKLIFFISILISFQNTVYAMSSYESIKVDNPDIEYPEPKPTDDTPKKNIDLLNDNSQTEQFKLEARINGNLIEEYTKQTKLAEKNKNQKENWQPLQYCDDNSLDDLKEKNDLLKGFVRDIKEENRIEQEKIDRNKAIEANNSIAIRELSHITGESPDIKKHVEEYKQQRLNEPKNPQIGNIIYKPVPDNFTISKIRNAIPSWSSIFLGYPWEYIKNIYRKSTQPVSTLEYIQSFWKPLPIKEKPVELEFVGFPNEMKTELESLLANSPIKNCTKIVFEQADNLATSKSVFDADKVICTDGVYTVRFDRTRNYSIYANPETRLKIVAHNIENNPDYDAWKKLMRWKVFYGIVLGGSAALQAYRFFHLPADAESTTNNSTQYIATAFAGTIGLFGGLLWGNKHKQTQEQKETEYRKAIVAKDGYYDDMAEDAALEPELLYNKKIKRLINDKEVELGDSLQEYGITMNLASQQRKDLIQYARSKRYPRYKLPAYIPTEE